MRVDMHAVRDVCASENNDHTEDDAGAQERSAFGRASLGALIDPRRADNDTAGAANGSLNLKSHPIAQPQLENITLPPHLSCRSCVIVSRNAHTRSCRPGEANWRISVPLLTCSMVITRQGRHAHGSTTIWYARLVAALQLWKGDDEKTL